MKGWNLPIYVLSRTDVTSVKRHYPRCAGRLLLSSKIQ